MVPAITGLYGALNAILNVILANNVSTLRRRHKISIGLGESKELTLANRIHGNNAEFVPLAIVMMLLAELNGGSPVLLHVYGGLLLVARVLHAFGMPKRAPNPFRVVGTALTWFLIVGISVQVIVLHFRH